jgi:NOL1/NOP2/sun family putative RNA methylase
MVNVDPKFVERYKRLLGTRYDEFFSCSMTPLNKAIRVNTLKINVKDFVKRLKNDWELTPVPWCKEGFWIKHKTEERYDIGNIFGHPLGYFYVQDPASMIPPVVLNPQPGELVLDMTAAPGSKSTQMASYMKNTGILCLNDNAPQRLKALEINVRRMGITNAILLCLQGMHLAKLGKEGILFDRVLLDAPCSGSGTIRKSYKTVTKYSYNFVKGMVKTQQKLILTAFDLLKSGGTMVYSTCTLEPEEDEGVVSYLLEQREDASIVPIKLDIKRSDVFTEWDGQKYHPDVKNALRIYPQDNDTEGFFVCKIMKK